MGGGGRLGLLSLIELLHGPETLLQYSLSPGLRHSAAAAAGPRCSGKRRGWCRGGASARPPMIQTNNNTRYKMARHAGIRGCVSGVFFGLSNHTFLVKFSV